MKVTKLLILACMMIGMYSSLYAQPIDSTTLNSASITSNTTLNASTRYLMKGNNNVKNGATLIIQPGTIILGDFESKGTLIVERGGKIFANGSANQPIVFTSEKPAGNRNPGDWGGIIILGRSGINTASGSDSAEIEGFGAGLGPIYGGQPRIDDDSSGVLRYVRIEFSGVNLTGVSGNEINGLTMGGVGSKTVIEYIMVSYNGDDSFEWFGGNVNCKYLISYKPVDDDWDTDNGFRGKIQYGLSVRDSGIYDVSTSNGFESDNNTNSPSSGTYNSPRTMPIFSNMTVVGPFSSTGLTLNSLWGRGGHLRRASQISIYNSIIMGWRVGIRLDGPSIRGASGDTLQIRNTILGGNVKLGDTASVPSGFESFSTQAWLGTGSYNNTIFGTASSVQLTDPFAVYPDAGDGTVDKWMPVGGSPALSGADFSNPNLAGFDNVTFRGAFGTTNWTSGWAVFNPRGYTIGIQQISSNVPNDFTLSQNYPNPFNPVTNIKFELPQSGFVTLKVFNMLGEEVSTLVNQDMNVGTYKYDFDASSLATGAYFYKMTVTNSNGSFTDVKKMMLIK
ncbi:MAG TPA: T9SS type A sorting domain-containing protein [Ignavibacteria bacterium]|nr:T9SS type A sorting domain-containing protein [Ignavibacteria bacterium]HRJ04895.1 T9SS type A sorting domain-containing protein [Ignavibacteria bacterium]HRJ84852.1 T9SS type A sorting domain-containing protein [Ignavibacteria bacterium]